MLRFGLISILLAAISIATGQFQPNSAVQERIDRNVAIVNRLAETAIEEFGQRCSGSCSSGSCSQLACKPSCAIEYGSTPVTTFQGQCSQTCSSRKLDFENSVVRYPSPNPSNISNAEVATETCWTRNMDTRFKQELAVSFE